MPDFVIWGVSIVIIGGSLVVAVLALVRFLRDERRDDRDR